MASFTFASTGTLENKKAGDSDYFYDEFYDKLKSLQEKSDFVIVTVKGKEYYTSEVNYRGGVCDDCTEFRNYEIEKAEGFKR